ncbi:conserved protein, unknown function, partial [Hepatocystis sp. ex Piliocolobus tephrosceles]
FSSDSDDSNKNRKFKRKLKKYTEQEDDNENENENEEKLNTSEVVKKQKLSHEKKRLQKKQMRHMFELEAEESEDENIEDPEERRRAQLLKKEKGLREEDESDIDEQYSSDEMNEFIINEDCNNNNDDAAIKLRHKQEMEKLEEDMFLKKFTYQGKEFDKELTNKEKLELERERQLLKKKKLLMNSAYGRVNPSDFESESSSSDSPDLKKRMKKSLKNAYYEEDDLDGLGENNHSYNENVFKKGESIDDITDEKKRNIILEKINNVIYTKEVQTNEGNKIVIKKKKKIRFRQNLSDVTITEEEDIEEYEKTKKKPIKIIDNSSVQTNKTNFNKNTVNDMNKASIKWNNNIKDISDLDTPTNSDVFKGFRKVEQA